MIALFNLQSKQLLLIYFLLLSCTSLSVIYAIDDTESVALEKLVSSKEQFKTWYEKAHISLKDRYNRIIELNLVNQRDSQSDVALSVTQQSALRNVIYWNVQAFCATSFDEYYKVNKNFVDGDLNISPAGYMKMRYTLKHRDAIIRPELLPDYELAEAYWVVASRVGFLNTHFVDLIPNESFYKLSELRDVRELATDPDPFPKDRKTCGQVLQATSFIWSDSDPVAEFKSKGKLLVADIRYMIKTNVKNLAFPINIRMYWNEGLERWIPWFCIEYNAPERRCKVVF